MTQPRPGAAAGSANPDPIAALVANHERLQQIITDDSAIEIMIEEADKIGRALKDAKLTTSQVRIFFGVVRQIQADVVASGADQLNDATHRRLMMLIPRLAYQAKRDSEKERSKGVEQLQRVLAPAIRLVRRNPQNFQRFVDFFEAILAYHKVQGGQ